MEELIDIDNYNDKINYIKEKVSKSDKKNKKVLSKNDKKLKSKNKIRKYIILILSFIIIFIAYHLLSQYEENMRSLLLIQEKNLLNYQQNINGSMREIEEIEYENDILEKEISKYKIKYEEYKIENNKLII